MSECIGRDPTCPCQDGDPCHYEGVDPMPVAWPKDRKPWMVYGKLPLGFEGLRDFIEEVPDE